MPVSANLPDNGVLTSDFYNMYIREQVIVTCTSATRPTGVEGRYIFETDTRREVRHDGTTWVVKNSPWTQLPTPAFNNLTIGDGSSNIWWRYVDGDIRVKGGITWGSTTSASGIWGIDIPDGKTAGGFSTSLGYANYNDASGADSNGLAACLASTTDIYFISGAGVAVAASVPFTWATGDVLVFDITVSL